MKKIYINDLYYQLEYLQTTNKKYLEKYILNQKFINEVLLLKSPCPKSITDWCVCESENRTLMFTLVSADKSLDILKTAEILLGNGIIPYLCFVSKTGQLTFWEFSSETDFLDGSYHSELIDFKSLVAKFDMEINKNKESRTNTLEEQNQLIETINQLDQLEPCYLQTVIFSLISTAFLNCILVNLFIYENQNAVYGTYTLYKNFTTTGFISVDKKLFNLLMSLQFSGIDILLSILYTPAKYPFYIFLEDKKVNKLSKWVHFPLYKNTEELMSLECKKNVVYLDSSCFKTKKKKKV